MLEGLSEKLIDELYGGDLAWIADGKLVGLPERETVLGERRQWFSQRGNHWPPPQGFAYGEGDTVLDF